MKELDLRSIFFLLLSRLKYLILGLVLGAVLLGCYTAFLVPKKYVSHASIYIYNIAENTQASAATSSNLSASERLATTVQTAATADWALEEASKMLGERLTSAELKRYTTFTPVPDTSFLNITVSYTDPELAQQSCNVMTQIAVQAFEATGETGSTRITQYAVPAQESSPGLVKMSILGGLGGMLIVAVIVILISMLNTTVQSKEDLQKVLDIPVLGEIPSFDLSGKGGNKRGR